MCALPILGSFALFPFLGKEFMPQRQEGSIMWRVTGIPSTSLNESIRTSNEIAEAFKQFPEVDTTVAMIDRAAQGETADVNYMEIYTALKAEEDSTTGSSMKQMREELGATLGEASPNVDSTYAHTSKMCVYERTPRIREHIA